MNLLKEVIKKQKSRIKKEKKNLLSKNKVNQKQNEIIKNKHIVSNESRKLTQLNFNEKSKDSTLGDKGSILGKNFDAVPQGELKNGKEKSDQRKVIALKKPIKKERNLELPQGSQSEALNWVINKVHPHNYNNILGYRKKNDSGDLIVNPNITIQGIRRVLHFLKTLINIKKGSSGNTSRKSNLNSVHTASSMSIKTEPFELIVVIESATKTRSQQLAIGGESKVDSKPSSTDLLIYNILRLKTFATLKITVKTAKETISYLAQPGGVNQSKNLCGVLMLNPAKSVLGTLADNLFNQTNKKNRKLSINKAIGVLCSKNGIPLISLCDISSALNFYTYPIICNTRNIDSIYYVFDLLTYGINQLIQNPKGSSQS